MRSKILAIALAAVIGGTLFQAAGISYSDKGIAATRKGVDYDSSYYDEGDGYDSEDEEEENEESTELTKGDIKVSPAKKTIKVGGSFNIEVYPSDDVSDEYADMPDEEWEEILDNNIDNITFKSTKSSVAYVSTKGKVKGKKKGSAIIKTTITFADSSEGIYKTKVYVKR